MTMIGVTGTQGKTTTTRLARGRAAGLRHPGRGHRHRRHPHRRRGRRHLAHHPRGARPARAVRADARARRRGLRDGGLQPRAGHGPRRRRASSTARSSSTSGATTSTSTPTSRTTTAPRPRCSPPGAPAGPWSTSTTSTAAGWPGRPRCGACRTFSAAARRTPTGPSTDVELAADRSTFTVAGAGRAAAARGLPAARAPSTSTTPWPPSPPAPWPASTRPRSPRRSPPVRACPAASSASTAGQDFTVVVDYAHKPDAVAAALEHPAPADRGPAAARARRRRRPRPRQAADDGRDRRPRWPTSFVVTDDNPRTEDPAAIRAEVAAGARRGGPGRGLEIGDRRAAIAHAVGRAAARRHRAGRRQGPRDRPGGRRASCTPSTTGSWWPRGAGPCDSRGAREPTACGAVTAAPVGEDGPRAAGPAPARRATSGGRRA